MKCQPAIIFDLDGTLADSVPGIKLSILYALRQQGHAVNDELDLRPLIGPPMKQIFAKLLDPLGDSRIDEAVKIYRDHYSETGLLKTTLYPQVVETLDFLRQKGFSLYIATSKRQTFAETILKNTGIEHLFTAVQGTPPDGSLDDKSELVKHLLSTHHLSQQNSVLIGDRRDDIIAARANHIGSIGALWGYGSISELQQAGAVIFAETPKHLTTLIQGILLS